MTTTQKPADNSNPLTGTRHANRYSQMLRRQRALERLKDAKHPHWWDSTSLKAEGTLDRWRKKWTADVEAAKAILGARIAAFSPSHTPG